MALNLKNAGMDIASHSYTHAQLTKVGSAQLEREIGTSKQVIEDAVGTEVNLFRLPYGAGTNEGNVRAKIAEHKMVHVFWTVDTLDWQDKNPQSIYNRTIRQITGQKSGVVLFHDIHSQSVTASTMLMDWFNQNNTKVCTVQGVVDQLNNKTKDCK
jgi:peptidoglycan/xylan/chitin deacetylase (PgdA/CDA1 family)